MSVRTSRELSRILASIDGRGYKAYQDLRGEYQFQGYTLHIDHVQGDPYAPPSKARVSLPMELAGFPLEMFDKPHKRIAVVDFLTRAFHEGIKECYRGPGSGRQRCIFIDSCGQEMLDRTSILINEKRLEARFEIELPAAGRRIQGREAAWIFLSALPFIINRSLLYKNVDREALKRHVQLAEEQACIREELARRGLVAFVANGSILPRESGVSDRPMADGAVPFKSPESLETEIALPTGRSIKGMGIPGGVTLIVGGGYHGKSTLLKALELGVYNHIPGDGREYVITRQDAVKIRAEDGRSICNVNISGFIGKLPNGQDTSRFTSENASGSTSQAANIVEALETGTGLLLIDEDTSATNFMIRDARMQRLVAGEKEPITPFIDRVRQLYAEHGVSSILVVGGSGDYFDVADLVIMMDEYVPRDVTQKAFEIARELAAERDRPAAASFGPITQRIVLKSSFPSPEKELKIKAKGLHTVLCGKMPIDLSQLSQLTDTSQTNCLAVMLQYFVKKLVDGNTSLSRTIDRLYRLIEEKGLDAVSPYTGHPGNLALPRKHEFAAMINRCRDLKVRQEGQ